MDIFSLDGAYLVILSAIIFPLYWILFAIFLPMRKAYIEWVSSNNWIWVNSIGFAGSIVGVFASMLIYLFIGESVLNIVSFSIVIIGSIMMGALLYFEAFILPGLKATAPSLVDQSGPFYTSRPFVIARTLGGIILSLGYILWGLAWIAAGIPAWSAISVMIGAPLFSLVFMPPNLRLMGVFAYSAGIFGIGLHMLTS